VTEKKDDEDLANDLDDLIEICEKKDKSNLKKCCPCEDGTQ